MRGFMRAKIWEKIVLYNMELWWPLGLQLGNQCLLLRVRGQVNEFFLKFSNQMEC